MSLQTHAEVLTPVNVTLNGNKDFADVLKLGRGHLSGLESNTIGVLQRRREDSNMRRTESHIATETENEVLW